MPSKQVSSQGPIHLRQWQCSGTTSNQTIRGAGAYLNLPARLLAVVDNTGASAKLRQEQNQRINHINTILICESGK